MINTYVTGRLSTWAEWRARREAGGLGYPKQCAFAKGDASGGRWTPEMDSNAYEMERCVVALGVRSPDLKQAIIEEFTITGTQAQKAKRCGWCLRTYQYKLEIAYNQILGLLNDVAAGVPLPISEAQEKKFAAIA